MSRRQGHRRRPAPERKAIADKYAKKSRRERRRSDASKAEPTRFESQTRWSAVLAGTLLSVVAYGLMAMAVIEAADGNDTGAGWAAAGAAAVVPLLLGVLGFLTRAATPWRTAMLVSGGVVAVFLAGSFLAQDVATGYVLAIGVGATFAMRLVPDVHDRRWRLWTTAGLAAYVKVVYVLSPSIAVVAAPLLPIIGISIVDSIRERRVRA